MQPRTTRLEPALAVARHPIASATIGPTTRSATFSTAEPPTELFNPTASQDSAISAPAKVEAWVRRVSATRAAALIVPTTYAPSTAATIATAIQVRAPETTP